MTMSPLTGLPLVFASFISFSFCFSGSGQTDVCDLFMCGPIGPENRQAMLENSPASIVSMLGPQPGCSLGCTDSNVYSNCIPCRYSGPTFPDSPVYLLDLPDSQTMEGPINITITGISENFTIQQTSAIVVNESGFFLPLDVTGFSCSELLIEYQLNRVLVEQTVCLDYRPSAPLNASYEFRSACYDEDDISNAIIAVEWNISTIAFNYWILQYNVTLVDDSNGFTTTVFVAPNSSTATLSNGILLEREYLLMITPYPIGVSSTIRSVHTRLPDPIVQYSISTTYNPETVTYSIIYTRSSNFDCSVVNNIEVTELTLYSSVNNDSGFSSDTKVIGEVDIEPVVGNFTYRYEYSGLAYSPILEYHVELQTFYHFVIPPYKHKLESLSGQIAFRTPFPPNDVTEITVSNFIRSELDIASFTVEWSPPKYANGQNITYYLWVGAEMLNMNSGPPNNPANKIFYKESIVDNSVSVAKVQTFFVPVLYIQILSTNNLCVQVTPICYSNWSQPVVYTLPSNNLQEATTPAAVASPSVSHSSMLLTVSSFQSKSVPTQSPDPASSTFQQILWPLVGVIGGLFLVVTALATIITCCCCFGGKLIKRDIAMDPMIGFNDPKVNAQLYVPYPPFKCLEIEEWEIPRDILQVYEDEILGSGCFGEVCKGSLQMHYIHKRRRLSHQHDIHRLLPNTKTKEWLPVAVKKLKRTADGKERADFLKEIDTMIRVSETKSELKRFVVNTLGCCRLHEPILLVVEFVSHGDLLHYLRAEKKKKVEECNGSNIPVPYLEPVHEYSHLEPLKNQVIDIDTEGNLTSKHLLDFSRQIAAGMEFLSGLDIIHRDLACRNILVGSDKMLKISDFGLARTVPQDEVYTLTNHGRLPLRWMALESIFQREFTSTSDVWSYGVVLWEICTMGKFPYASLTEKDLLRLLKKGHRLEKPENCSQEIYEVMHQCWHPNPQGRPKFSDLHKLFDRYLSKHTEEKYPYIDLDSSTPYTFDHLTPKSLSDYRAQMNEALTIEDLEKGEKKDESSSPPFVYIDNRLHDSDSDELNNTNYESCDNGPLSGGVHVGVYRLQGNKNIQPYPESYDKLKQEEDSFLYDREVLDTLNSIYMTEDDHQDYQDSLWYKKLSTITEVSNEDCQM